MVVLNREIANLNTSSLFSAMYNPHEPNTIPENIQISAIRDRTTIFSMISSRESSVISKASSVEYSAHMKAQSADPN